MFSITPNSYPSNNSSTNHKSKRREALEQDRFHFNHDNNNTTTISLNHDNSNTTTTISPTNRTLTYEVNNDTTYYDTYYVDSDADDLINSKSYICSTLPIFRKKRAQQPSQFTKQQKKSPSSKEDRWNILSNLAHDHKNCDPSILDLTHKQELETPEMLRYGVTPDVASIILELRVHSSIVEEGCGWPHFLDVISTLLINLRHLQCWYPDEVKPYYEDYDSCITFEQKRMLRLYILYRLPDLQSINEEYVTEEERNIARPCTPLGIQVRRDDWCTGSMIGYQHDTYSTYTDTTSSSTPPQDECEEEIGVEVIAADSKSHEDDELEDEEIMHMVQNVLVQDIFCNDTTVVSPSNRIDQSEEVVVNSDVPQNSVVEEKCDYISFRRSNLVSPSASNNQRPPKHPSRRRHSSLRAQKKNRNTFSSHSSSIIDKSYSISSSSSSSSDCETCDLNWI